MPRFKAESSRYPIKAGNILAVKEPVHYWSPKYKKHYDCKLFIWILRESTVRKKGVLAKRRRVNVFYYYELLLPEAGKKHFITPIRDVQFESVIVQIRKGYEVVAEGIRYNHRNEDIGRFYRIVGAL